MQCNVTAEYLIQLTVLISSVENIQEIWQIQLILENVTESFERRDNNKEDISC